MKQDEREAAHLKEEKILCPPFILPPVLVSFEVFSNIFILLINYTSQLSKMLSDVILD